MKSYIFKKKFRFGTVFQGWIEFDKGQPIGFAVKDIDEIYIWFFCDKKLQFRPITDNTYVEILNKVRKDPLNIVGNVYNKYKKEAKKGELNDNIYGK